MRILTTLTLTASLGATALGAQDASTPISPEDWRALAAGRTLTYTINGEFFALERYATSGDGVSIQLNDGRCMAGHWTFQDDAYCYFWEGNAPVCFLHERRGEDIEIRQVVDGVETGSIQTMTNVSDAPLQCGGLTS